MSEATSTDRATQASCLKAKGNALFRNGEYLAAVVEFTAGIELDRSNPILFSNRSSAFLKLHQHFYALKDAEAAIQLNSKWSKGYYRKGQVEEAAERYDLARRSYQSGLDVNPLDEGLRNALANLAALEADARHKSNVQRRKHVIFFSTLASVIVAADMHLRVGLFRSHARWLFIAFSLVFALIFSQVKASIHRARMNKRLKPPKDLLKQLEREAEDAMMLSTSCEDSQDYTTTSSDKRSS